MSKYGTYQYGYRPYDDIKSYLDVSAAATATYAVGAEFKLVRNCKVQVAVKITDDFGYLLLKPAYAAITPDFTTAVTANLIKQAFVAADAVFFADIRLKYITVAVATGAAFSADISTRLLHVARVSADYTVDASVRPVLLRKVFGSAAIVFDARGYARYLWELIPDTETEIWSDIPDYDIEWTPIPPVNLDDIWTAPTDAADEIWTPIPHVGDLWRHRRY